MFAYALPPKVLTLSRLSPGQLVACPSGIWINDPSTRVLHPYRGMGAMKSRNPDYRIRRFSGRFWAVIGQ